MAEARAGKDQEQNPKQQQDAPGRAQFFQDRPEEFQHGVEDAPRLCLLPSPRPIIPLVKAITGPRLGVELRPQLVELESIGHALPELVELRLETGTLPCG